MRSALSSNIFPDLMPYYYSKLLDVMVIGSTIVVEESKLILIRRSLAQS